MTKQQEILRKTAKFLYCVAEGAPTTLEDFKTFSDLCWLTIPMKYRMNRTEIDEIKGCPWVSPKAAEAPGGQDLETKQKDFAIKVLNDDLEHAVSCMNRSCRRCNEIQRRFGPAQEGEGFACQSAPAASSERAEAKDELLLAFMEEWTKETLGDGLATMREKAAYQAGWQARAGLEVNE